MSINGEILSASGAGSSYLYAVAQGLMGLCGFLLLLNFRDAAYRVYEFFLNHGPFAPGPGFGPLVIRAVGGILGLSLTWTGVSTLLSR
ncbi:MULTISPECIES: hypothetical protein [Streptomyces]|uniref:hypothetical protein n=1 Tax=Streptomyces TaxID=1883 RepID=UPI000BF007DA|nr:hypothetical protein [Streptomyces sp. b84]WTE28002.1 hypothetical protein OHB50_21345 [Streptomyces anulatus]